MVSSLAWLALSVSAAWAAAEPAAPAAALAPASEGEDLLPRLYVPQPDGLTLERALEMALRHSPELERARATLAGAELRADWAPSVFLPRISGEARYARLSEVEPPALELPDLGGLLDDFEDSFKFIQPPNNYSLSASLMLPVSDYILSMPSLYKMAKQGYLAQLAQTRAVEQQVLFVTAQTYLAVLSSRAAARVNHEAAVTLERRAEDLARLFAAGDVTEADVMAVRAQAAARRNAAVRADGQARLNERRLRRALGLPQGDELALAIDPFVAPPAPEAGLQEAIALAAEQRPEVRALLAAIEVQRAEAFRRFGGMFPKISAGGQVDYANPNPRIIPIVEEFHGTWQLFASVAWSPVDFITERTFWIEEELELEALAADLRGLRENLELEVNSALIDWEAAASGLASAQERLAAADRAYRDQQRLFELGEGTVQNLLEREQDYREAALARIDAAIAMYLARLSYDRSVGQLGANVPGRTRPEE